MGVLLKIKDLSIRYNTDAGVVEALNGVSFDLEDGVTLGLVGETGAGKTTLAKGIMRLIRTPPGEIASGEIFYRGEDLLGLSIQEFRKIRGKEIAMIFQDPMTSLNPVMTVGNQIAETIENHEKLSKKEAYKKAIEMLEIVGIGGERADDYPHQFSGGMKQRVVIAIALACNPKVLIADEPTTALDVTIQAQVLELIQKLEKKFNTATLLITHDLGVVAQTCQKVAIIYAGRIVEYGSIHDIFKRPQHPYTKGLFDSIPKIHSNEHRLRPIKGLMPDPMALPVGCSFYERCNSRIDECSLKQPEMIHVQGEHYVSCFNAECTMPKEEY